MENTDNKTNNSQTTEAEEEECTPFEKIMNLNKLGALFLSSDKYDKALSILSKTYDFYIAKKENKEIPNFFYSNLYCNLAKAHSCIKNFKEAEKYYRDCILNHPLYKILINEKEFMKNEFLFDIENLIVIKQGIDLENIISKFDILMKFFSCEYQNHLDSEIQKLSLTSEKSNFSQKISKKFKPNNLNSISSFTDSLVNLAVIFQYFHKETTTAYDMYCLALLLEPENNVANIDFNNFLREINLKEKSDLYIIQRIKYGYINENEKNLEVEINPINAKRISMQKLQEQSLSFVCMKWGAKYGADYVNKLYSGVKRNTTKKFNFYCITDNHSDLDQEIKILKLESNFKGWMRKSILFWDNYTNQLTSDGEEIICFIDLDMIIYSNIDFLWEYQGNFMIMQTDDIQCENSKDGYNSSIILWRKNIGREIYDYMARYDKWINKQVIRFDHYLEFIVKDADFIQEVYKGKVLDYNTYCKDKEVLPEMGAIVAFPRNPKPHECSEKWISRFWN